MLGHVRRKQTLRNTKCVKCRAYTHVSFNMCDVLDNRSKPANPPMVNVLSSRGPRSFSLSAASCTGGRVIWEEQEVRIVPRNSSRKSLSTPNEMPRMGFCFFCGYAFSKNTLKPETSTTAGGGAIQHTLN